MLILNRLDPNLISASSALCLFVFYIFCLFTVAPITFRKGYTWLGIIGIVLPILWLIGATLKTKPGSYFARQQGLTERGRMDEYTR